MSEGGSHFRENPLAHRSGVPLHTTVASRLGWWSLFGTVLMLIFYTTKYLPGARKKKRENLGESRGRKLGIKLGSEKGLARSNPRALVFTGRRNRTRTCDPCLVRAMLYQLSYPPARIPPREKTP